jgi:hypothetical protein
VVTIPLAPRTARAIAPAVGERVDGPIFPGPDRQRLDRHGAAGIGPGTSAAPGSQARRSAGRVPFRRCPDDGTNPSLGEEHGEIPRRGQSPVAGLAA